MANAALNPIYERLNNAQAFHPLTAETFADWSMEAGDIVTISRDGNTYTSPVGTSRMVWRGSQQISIDSTGTKEREPISKVSRKKFSRGGGTANNNAFFYNEIFSDDGEVHSVVQQTASTFSVEVSKRARVFESYEDPVRQGETVSPGDFWIKTNNVETWDEFTRVSWVYGSDFDWNDYKGALVYVRTEYNTWRMVSNQQLLLDHSTKIDQDENHISLIAQDVQRIDGNVEKNYAELRVESDRISSEVISTRDGLNSRIDQTASSITATVEDKYNQMSSGLELTSSSAALYVENKYTQMSSGLSLTSSTAALYVDNKYSQMSSGLNLTSSSAALYVDNKYSQMSSGLKLTSSTAALYVDDKYRQMSSGLKLTSSSAALYVDDKYREMSAALVLTSSNFSVEVGKRAKVFLSYEDPVRLGETVNKGDFWVKTNDVETWDEFKNSDWTYSSTFNWNDYKGCITYTRTDHGTWRLLSNEQEILDHSTRIDQDEDHISLIAQDVQRVDGNVQKNYSEFRVTSQQISAEVVNTKNGLESQITQTASSITATVNDKYNQMSSGLSLTSSSAALYVDNKYTQMSSGLNLTSSSAALYVDNKYTQMSSGLNLTSSSAALYVDNKYTQMSSGLKLTSSSAALYVDNKYTQMSSGLKLTSSSAALYVDNKYDQMSSGLDLTSSSAAFYVNSKYDQMKAGIGLTSSSAIMYAQNRTTRAYIMTRINANNEGEALIEADKVKISGTTTINDVMTITDNKLYVKKDMRNEGDVMTKTLTLREGASDVTLTEADLETIIKSASVSADGKTLTLTPMRGNAITFNKATSLSGAWSSSIYTVTASPQGDKWSIGFDSSAKEYLTVYGGAETPYTQGDTVNYNYLYKTIKIGTVNSGAAPTDRYTVDNILVDTSSIYSAGIASYYGSSYWGRPSSSNNYICSVPNITNTASETWFDAKSLVAISGGWSGDTFTARANPGNKPYSTSLYSVNCTNVTESSGTLGDKYVSATIRLAWDGDPDDGEASHTISKTVPVNAEIAYNKGYAVTHSQFSKAANPAAYSSRDQGYSTNGKLSLGAISKSAILAPGYLEVQCKVHGHTEKMYVAINE